MLSDKVGLCFQIEQNILLHSKKIRQLLPVRDSWPAARFLTVEVSGINFCSIGRSFRFLLQSNIFQNPISESQFRGIARSNSQWCRNQLQWNGFEIRKWLLLAFYDIVEWLSWWIQYTPISSECRRRVVIVLTIKLASLHSHQSHWHPSRCWPKHHALAK